MGYYTTYSLTCSSPETLEDVLASGELELVFSDFETVSEPCKWYDHECDMRKISQKHPNVIFSLKGQGETHDDIWIKHFLNGKMQTVRGQIVFEAFDSDQLK